MKRIVFLFLLLTNFCLARTSQSGLILPDFSRIDETDVCCIYTPKEGFLVYDSPNGQITGKLMRRNESKKDDQSPYKLFFFPNNSKPPKQIDLTDFYQVGYEVWAIQYFERRDGFVRIKYKNFWLKEEEVKAKGFTLTNWQSYFITHANDLLGLYANDPGLNLRKSPNSTSELLKTLKGDLFQITPINQNNGPWTKVKVRKYKEHPCTSDIDQSEIIEYELEGWIKIVDDNGLPNVWYYSRGC